MKTNPDPLIEHFRSAAIELIKIARALEDAAAASKLEKIAIEILKRATELEKDPRF